MVQVIQIDEARISNRLGEKAGGLCWRDVARASEAYVEHAAIIEAVGKHDLGAVEDAIRRHIDASLKSRLVVFAEPAGLDHTTGAGDEDYAGGPNEDC